MFTSIGPVSLHLFAHHIAWAVLLSAGTAYVVLRRGYPARALADVLTAAMVLGVVGARLEYALLNPELFAGNLRGLITMAPGGLDWHGAVVGGLLGVWIIARLHGLPACVLLDAAAPAPPMIAFAGWTACREVGCVSGVEVETLAYYPVWLVTEGRDVFGLIAPRYDTHTFGQALAVGLVLLTALLWMTGALAARPGGCFWLVLALLSAGMAAVGTVRGDYTPMPGGLRADLYLDGVLFALAAVMLGWGLHRAPRQTLP